MPKKLYGSLWGVAVAAVLVVSGNVRAEDIPWTINGNADPIISGTSKILFEGKPSIVENGSGVVIFNLKTESEALTGSFDKVDQDYTLKVTISDVKSQTDESGVKWQDTLEFKGNIKADISKASVPKFDNVFKGQTKQKVLLGSEDKGYREYEVELDSFTAPGPMGEAVGAVHATVTVKEVDGPGATDSTTGGTTGGTTDGTTDNTDGNTGGGTDESPEPNESPEPSSLLLAGFGLSALGAAAWRKRKNRKNQN